MQPKRIIAVVSGRYNFNVMKKIAIAFVLCFSFMFLAMGQQDDEFKTVFPKREKGERKLKVTGFGGPMMQFTSIGGDFAHMMGGGGAVLFNSFYFGGYGYGNTNDIPYKNQEEEYNLDFGFGGLWFGYIFKPYSPVHFDISAQVGGGSISRTLKNNDFNSSEVDGESVFVVTPVAELQFNFSKLFRFGVGTSFNYVTGAGISRTAYTTKDFARPTFYLSFKFGYFY